MEKEVIRYYKVVESHFEQRGDRTFVVPEYHPQGVVIAVRITGEEDEEIGSNIKRRPEEWSIGWSLCGKRDRFNKKMGIQIARGMALNGSNRKIPEEMQEEVLKLKKYLEIDKNGKKREVFISGTID